MNSRAAAPWDTLAAVDSPRAVWWVVCGGALLHATFLVAAAIVSSGDVAALAQPRFAVFLSLMAFWCAAEAFAHAPRPCCKKPGAIHAAWLPAAIGAALLASSVVGVSEYARRLEPVSDLDAIMSFAGATMMALGITLRIIAIRALGRFFLDGLTLLDEHPRVNTGIYAHMQHPSELGSLFLTTGMVATLGSPMGGLVVLLILLPLILMRMHLENTLMAAAPNAVCAWK